MTQLEEKALLHFHSSCSVLIVGPTQSGKTVLTFKIIKQSKEMFTSPPVKTVYCYSVYQELFSKMEKEIENIFFHEGLRTSEDINAWSENKEHILLVLDDLLATAVNSVDIMNLFTELLKSFLNRYIMTREMILIPKQKYEAVLGRREEDENVKKHSLTDNQSQTVPKDNHSESSEKQLLGEKFDTLIDISIP
ncbi:ORC4 [Mytilus coruscus]|uniref:ORC4 n=1 Tax=Mytilus coruscus TaxID=42192 RepID=A0A6J8AIW5_MYTCO|nr:ORC4 [Mytilus coruscus]